MVLDPLGALLGRSWDPIMLFGGLLGRHVESTSLPKSPPKSILVSLGASWGPLGVFFGRSWAVREVLERSWRAPGRSWVVLGRSWDGSVWDTDEAIYKRSVAFKEILSYFHLQATLQIWE